MRLNKTLVLLATHTAIGGLGFALGIYALPILIAPPAPEQAAVAAVAERASYSAEFHRDLMDSDALHWGEGTLSVNTDMIAFTGQLAPGPDYQLYLSPQFVETEADFNRLKPKMVRVGPVKTFDNFLLPVPAGIDPSAYTSAIVWCETFGQFISAGQYRQP